MATDKPIRVRFAPSPTGYLHVGGLRTALYNYLIARKNGGMFILRIEDTDQKRYVGGAAESMAKILTSFDIQPDEGVMWEDGGIVEKGNRGPYIQSHRLEIYRKHAEELVATGKAYRCFCTSERLEEMRAAQVAAKRVPKYDRTCTKLTAKDIAGKIAAGEKSVVRFRVPDERDDIRFTDVIRGEVRFDVATLDDHVLMKSDNYPTYHLANVVDDHLMMVSHVIRGEEWLPSTPKHILLYEAFGWEAPQFAHLPLLLNPDKSKLSKRQGDVAVEDYLRKGYLKEALINFVALLGWNPGQGSTQELFTLEELAEAFDLSSVHKGGAVFDQKKLDWMNGEYIKKLSVDELFARMSAGGFLAKPLIADAPANLRGDAYVKRVLTIEQERLAKLSDVGEQNPFFFIADSDYPKERLIWKGNTKEATKMMLMKAVVELTAVTTDEWSDRGRLNELFLEAAGDQRGEYLWPLRVALTGAERSPSPSDCAYVLGREESLRRLDRAIERLS